MMRGYAPINIPTIIVLLLLFLVSPVAAENIDPISDGSQFAWGENLGWLNLEPDGNLGNGVHVTSAGLTGYIWSENAGWISLSCENTATCGIVTYGVANDGIGNLSGYAWAENLGWINFAPAGENVFIDACGAFNGKAWGENVGWINFRSADTDHALAMTSWVSPVDEVAPSTFVPVPILPWYTGSIDITLDSADCGTGVSDVYLSLNGGGFTATPGSAAITPVTEEGCNTLNFYAVDIAGNTEPVQSETICIDVTSPVITIDSPADGIPIAVNSIVNADYSVTDPLSGVDTVTATMPVGTQMDTSVPGNWSFTVWATDVAGNAGMLTSNFEIYIPGNMDPDNTGAQYAWSENAGWINLQPLYGPGVTVTHTAVEGYAWSENAGWINFAPAGSGVVNRGGELSGYAWGENTGWISFACENTFTCAAIDYGVNIDMVTGLFSGYAWAENIGWINFAPVSTGAAKTTWVATDSDGDGHVAGIDCNDNDINISPDAVEICDGLDNNCDGNIDEGLTTDADGDGHSTPGSCEGTQDDCDDNNDQSFPGNTEVCDGIDNNCDAQIDEGAVWSNLGAVCSDGIGECNAPGTMVCDTNNPAGPAVCNAVALLPSAEICDGLDNNCDGSVDEGLTTDADGDGYSTPGSCEGTRDDCDDTDPLKNADSPEICDGIDNDCDGLVDDADQVSSGVPAFIRASLNHEGNEVSRDPVLPVISGDGNVVAFKSSATDMVPGDTNGTSDIFVRNLLTNELKRVNVHSSGAQANGFTLEFDMSEDGNFVAFTSAATNLVDNDTNNRWDIFVHDISANITTRVSVNSAGDAGNGDSRYPSISHDGRYVSFSSSANNIIPGVTAQIYRHDRDTGTTIVASLDAFGNPIASTPLQSVMSADGQAVVFVSTGDNIVLDDTNGVSDVFVHDFISARTVRVSEDSAGNAGNAVSQYPELSRDGRYVAFESIATNLVAGDTNGQLDIFVHDLILHTTVRASVGSNETEADSGSHNPAISNDGRYVAFDSSATNLVPGGSDTSRHIYVRDLQLGTTEIVGLKNAVDPGWSHGQEASVSAGGRYIAFESRSSSLVADDTNGRPDIFIWDRYAPLSYFTDIDNDGFGDPNDTAYACALPATNGIDNCPDIANPDQADIDNDGIGDVCDPDNDNDGLSDDDEINIYGTDPLNPDTDGDTVSDGDEITEGSDPLVYNPGQVLVDLYNSTNGPGWRISTGWLGPRGTECSWYRVTCDAGGQIISVDLSRNRLSGTIPETIGALTALTELDLGSGNDISGSIPAGVGQLLNLTILKLDNTKISGQIPAFIGNLVNLTNLELQYAQFAGPIPDILGNLVLLTNLKMQGNDLNGSIPASFGNLINIQYLNLGGNQLAGAIPAEIGNMVSLTGLSLYRNQLSGSIPAELALLPVLESLDLNSNQLSGPIPDELGNMPNILYLYLGGNQLSGQIPASLGNLQFLEELELHSNELEGEIPAALGNLSNLYWLYLADNHLTGSIPASFGQLSSLMWLYVEGNKLSGEVPAELVNLPLLQNLDNNFSYNALYSADPQLNTFLDAKQYNGNWGATQTIAPENVSAGPLNGDSVTLSWTPIAYTADGGVYNILHSLTAGGPYTNVGTTADKTVAQFTATGLDTNVEHFFVIQTKTPAHASNRNDLVSEYSSEVSAAPVADTDGDGIPDSTDNCVMVPNPDQRDTNADEDDNLFLDGIQHYGNMCDGDFDNNGIVEIRDFILWRPFAGQQTNLTNEDMDLNGNGAIWTDDFIIWRGLYGKVPGPGVTE